MSRPPDRSSHTDKEMTSAEAEDHLQLYRKRLQRLASQLVLAEERARRQIAAELHDRIGQGLAAVQLQLGGLRKTTGEVSVLDGIDKLRDLVNQIVDDTRDLTFEISPPVLYQVGFDAALEWLADEYTRIHALDVTVTSDGQDIPLDEDMRGLLFRSTRELLFNATKHAQATRIEIGVHRNKDSVQVEVVDDGVGCSITALDDHSGEGMGLFSVRERMDSLGGTLRLNSAPGQGMRCVLIAPLNSSA